MANATASHPVSGAAYQLRLMRERRADNQARLRTLEMRLFHEAEAATRSNPGLPSTFGRYASDWTKRHEADFQRRLSELRAAARNEIGSIAQKITRQSDAIAAFHLKQARKAKRSNHGTRPSHL
ncbi:hypothetical protein [Pseudomonas sp.]|uniref:hypothetical protein n=1 Tax=Pseudomonas sp. TaxID=306 RepID=UPI003D11A4AF